MPSSLPLRRLPALAVRTALLCAATPLTAAATHEPHPASELSRYWELDPGSRPIRLDQPDGLRWYVQAFSGHGETLTDYNFRQTSVGAGVMFSPF